MTQDGPRFYQFKAQGVKIAYFEMPVAQNFTGKKFYLHKTKKS